MAKTRKAKHNLPGSIYKNGNRYWWKVKLPGENKIKARPLIPVNLHQAAKDYDVAVECAKIMFAMAVFQSEHKSSGPITNIAELSKVYLEYVDDYYRDLDGNSTTEPRNIRYSLNQLVDLCGCVLLEEFGPLKLMEVREQMVNAGITRKCINQRIGRIKRMFKWAVSQQIISPFVFQAINTVEGLKRGRCNAREGRKIKPVDEM